MPNELTNLLPRERKAVIARDYFLRLSVVGVVLLTVLVLCAALLLMPTYLFLVRSEGAETTRLATVESTLSSANETALSARLTALSSDAATLTALAHAPSASAILRSLLAVPRSGITLSGLAYTPGAGKAPVTVVVSGAAATRDALRNYQLALQSAPAVTSAALPVSAYASDTDISFTITVTLSL